MRPALRLRSPGKRRFERRAALWLATSIGVAAMAAPAAANENDDLMGAINRLCVAPARSVDLAAAQALRERLGPRDMGSSTDGGYARQIFLQKLGSGSTVLRYEAPSRKAPVALCSFASYSGDVENLAARLREAFALPEPANDGFGGFELFGRAQSGGRPVFVKVNYGKAPSGGGGAFTLIVSDGGKDEVEDAVKAIRALCLSPRRTSADEARAALRTPYAEKGQNAQPTPRNETFIRLTLGARGSFAIYRAPSPKAPLAQCEMIFTAAEMTRLADRLTKDFGLPSPVASESPRKFTAAGVAAVGDRRWPVTMGYELQNNMRSGSMILTFNREQARN